MTTRRHIVFSARVRALLGELPDYHTMRARFFAAARRWSGLGVVCDADNTIVSLPGAYRFGHHCTQALRTSNAFAARALVNAAAPRKGGLWEGMVAYDSTDPAADTQARHITELLAQSAVLDELDRARRERDQAIELLRDLYAVPHGAAAAIVTALEAAGTSLCPECDVWNIDALRDEAGYQPCARCGNWIHTTLVEPLHYGCARRYDCQDCLCVSRMTTTRQLSATMVTASDVYTAIGDCAFCTPRDTQGRTLDQRRFS